MVREIKIGFKTFKNDYDAYWLKVYDFSPKFGKFLKDETSFCLNKNKFSIFSLLKNKNVVHRFNETYEFLLEYPLEYPGKYNRWTQSKDPLDYADFNNSGYANVSGYTPMHIDWAGFGGLMRSYSGQCLIDGNIGSWHWDFAFGDYSTGYAGQTPGPSCVRVNQSILWIRIDPLQYFVKTCRIFNRNDRISSLSIILNIICVSR